MPEKTKTAVFFFLCFLAATGHLQCRFGMHLSVAAVAGQEQWSSIDQELGP